MLKFEKSFVILDLLADSSNQVIEELAGRLYEAGLVDADYGNATLARELEHPTGLPTRPFPIAFPHADATGVHQSALAVALLKQPVIFRNMADPEQALEVEIVIMLANRSPEEQIDSLKNLAELFGQPEKLAELKNITKAEKIVSWLSTELELES